MARVCCSWSTALHVALTRTLWKVDQKYLYRFEMLWWMMEKTSWTDRVTNGKLVHRVKCYIWSIALYGVETWTLRAVDEKHLGSFEMWCWRRMEKISWTDRVRNEGVLLRGKEQRNIPHEISKRKAKWISHVLRRNCLLDRVIGGKIKGG